MDTLDGTGFLSVARADEPSSRTDFVADTIRRAILSGQLKHGTTLAERRLATDLGVSKTPVREALIQLERSGLVTTFPNRGATVRRVEPMELREIYEARLRLEPWAVAKAARIAPDEIAATARAVLEGAAEAEKNQDKVAEGLENRRFHRILYSGCGNALVLRVLDNVQDLVALGVLSLLWPEWPTWRTEGEEHAAILEAFAGRDSKRVEHLLCDHIQTSIDRLNSLLVPDLQHAIRT
jgi:DNA-binding GntR family transcriptional regulator